MQEHNIEIDQRVNKQEFAEENKNEEFVKKEPSIIPSNWELNKDIERYNHDHKYAFSHHL